MKDALANEIKEQKKWNKKLSYMDTLISFLPKVGICGTNHHRMFLVFLTTKTFLEERA